MTKDKMQMLSFAGDSVRMVTIDGEPWWVAKDVCGVLGLGNITEALRGLDEDELTSEVLMSGGQGRQMLIVSEPGLYSLILRSRKPEAKAFKRWVTHDILPMIRAFGFYIAPGIERHRAVHDKIVEELCLLYSLSDTPARREVSIPNARRGSGTIRPDLIVESKKSVVFIEVKSGTLSEEQVLKKMVPDGYDDSIRAYSGKRKPIFFFVAPYVDRTKWMFDILADDGRVLYRVNTLKEFFQYVSGSINGQAHAKLNPMAMSDSLHPSRFPFINGGAMKIKRLSA